MGGSGRRAWGRIAAALLALSAARALGAEEPPAAPRGAPFVMSGDDGLIRVAEAFRLLYAEAFRRLEIPLDIQFYPLERRTALVVAGAIDGEMARIRAYGDAHPELVRVEEPVLDFAFALFSARADLALSSVDELRSAGLRVEYRRGVLLCERTLRAIVPAALLSDVNSTVQGVQKLKADRTDVYCDLDLYYVQEVERNPELASGPPVRRLLRFATLPTYPYLHRRHAALAPRLAEVLRQMKAEGLAMETYMRQVGVNREKLP